MNHKTFKEYIIEGGNSLDELQPPYIPVEKTGLIHRIWIGKTTQHAPRVKVDNPPNEIGKNGVGVDFSIPLIKPLQSVHKVGISRKELRRVYQWVDKNFDRLLDISRAHNAGDFNAVNDFIDELLPL